MTDEDCTAAKLKGYNCLIKFKDGEELVVRTKNLNGNDDEVAQWLMDVEKFINGCTDVEYFPIAGFAMSRESIKYIRKI